jgi:nucleotide-binding universal stress UspA family protein
MKTNKVSKILIALDYALTAVKVAETGFLLAQTMSAKVILLHVLSEPVYYSSREYSPVIGFTGYMEMGTLKSVCIERLKNASLLYLEDTKKQLGDKTILTIVKEGEFTDTILEAEKEVNADIIVIGSHSRRWLEEILMGSVTEKVLQHTLIPLLIVPTKKAINSSSGIN